MTGNPVSEIVYRYPQLAMKPVEGLSSTPEYMNIVRRGILPEIVNTDFIAGSDTDSLETYETPGGKVEVLHLGCREDFVHFTRMLAYRGEPRNIPDSIGAVSVMKIMNWRKGQKDSLIITSSGGYSGIKDYRVIEKSASEIDSQDKWLEVSKTIRTYHELTHFVSRRLYPANIDCIRDEVVADAIGIIKAFGEYNIELAKLFLGIEGERYRTGGRLEHYVSEKQDIEAVAGKALRIAESVLKSNIGADPFESLEYIEKSRIGIEE